MGAPQRCRKALGVRIAIDDFGTGLSSLASLRQLPIDGLKIDRELVLDIVEDPRASILIDNVIGISVQTPSQVGAG
jgi:EAL domain-containing protein (putative c-di-GMP-specific phosphodiesterase class I)